MTIPVKIVSHGPPSDTRIWVGRGYKEMRILEEAMSFRGLKIGERKVEPHEGVLILCTVTYGLRVIEIVAGGGRGRREWYDRSCLCNCNFSLGFIHSICDEELLGSTLYNVLACSGKKRYVLHRRVLASDFTPYVQGQKVLLVPYSRMNFLCCSTSGPSPAGSMVASGCRPMDSRRDDIESEDWRTVYRIIPWCAVQLPKFIKVRKREDKPR